jgi:hypothetical protein
MVQDSWRQIRIQQQGKIKSIKKQDQRLRSAQAGKSARSTRSEYKIKINNKVKGDEKKVSVLHFAG